jgi:nicotinamidase-related amidase
MTSHNDRRALIVIDVQRGFDDSRWGARNNPECERNVGRLIAAWRAAGLPIVFVQHDSQTADSPLAPGHAGHAFKQEVAGEPDLTVRKSAHSAFHGSPDLHAWLSERGIGAIYVSGIQTNVCCETTARVGSDLGYDVSFVLDATHTFDARTPEGEVVTADELARITATNLNGEFASVLTTDAAISALDRQTG